MKIKMINIGILLLTFCGTLGVLSTMPDKIPVHFNIYGVADRWGSKYEMLIMPVIMAVMLGIWFVCDKGFRKQVQNSPEEKERAEALLNIKVINVTFTVISVMFMLLNASFLYMSYTQLDSTADYSIDIMKLVAIVMGISFIVLGNFMPKTKNNAVLGFRLPWTRYNDVTWSKSNRFGGIAMVVSGIIITICALIFSGIVPMVIMMITLGLTMVVILIYAYLVYYDEVKKEK